MSSSLQPRPDQPVEASSTHPVQMPVQMSPLETLMRELRTKKQDRGSLASASIESALEAVFANRTRSFLTMLGIVVGIAAVIGALTLTQGVGAYVSNAINSQGANSIYIQPGAAKSGGVSVKQSTQTLTLNDLQILSRQPHVTAITPFINAGAQVVYANQNWRTRIQGVSTDLQAIQSWNLAQGLWFSTAQQASGSPVAVIGDTVYQNLFGPSGVNPVGKQIRIRNELFTVVGVLAAKGGFGQDDTIFVPYLAAQARLTNTNYLNEIELTVDDPANVDLVVQEITTTLEQTHHILKGNPDDFQTTTSAQLLQQSNQATSAISLLLTSIAGISLTVGGIGIMNIMLVSVTERTREIGIRMSIGARRRDIRNQFLIESLFLSIIGGIIGLLIGILVGWLTVNVIISSLSRSGGGGNVPLIITPTTLLLPFIVSAVIGVVFGLYPAIRASRLDPIVALRRAR